MGAFILIIVPIFFAPPRQPSGPAYVSEFFKKLADTLTGHQQSEEYFLKYVITYRRIMLQINPSTHDNKMKQERHYIVERLDMARNNLRNMYREGSMVYETFDIEVDAMIQKRGDVKYFQNMLIDKTQAAFIDAKIYFIENNQVNDIAITHIDLLVFNELFVHVHEVVKNLSGMKRMLMSYDDNLLDLLLYKLYQDQPDISYLMLQRQILII
ncbi:79_t:CDS:2 [Funneliformis mosseae]|uniref:79_t:CDS:1 n=1 Tax=Funneliformis mosseae TaxID=27381 RepID=A0A9N9BJJ6_FUNMO|nr:79_t:CDS:2 [Funneliformis mosseae]